MASVNGHGTPELLDSGGLIARRLLELPDRRADVGAMFLRGLLWRVHDLAGDGVATTSVLFRAVFEGGLRYLAAGGNAVQLRACLRLGLAAILDDLDRQTVPLEDGTQVAGLAHTLTSDAELADALSDAIVILGHHARIEIRRGDRHHHGVEFIDGSYWESPVLSDSMLSNRNLRRIDLERCLILASDLEIDDPRQLVRVLSLARESGAPGLILLANRLSEPCLALLLANRRAGAFEPVAIRTPGVSVQDRIDALSDIECLTGARALRAGAGSSPDAVQSSDFGTARRAWVDRTHFGIASGGGDARGLKAHVRNLELAWEGAEDGEHQTALGARICTLTGSGAVIRIGGDRKAAIDERCEQAKRLAVAIKAAWRTGTVPGGGAALYAARTALSESRCEPEDADARAANDILARALEAPIRAIIRNAGHDPGPILAGLDHEGDGAYWDARTGRTIGPGCRGLRDSAHTVNTAVRVAVEGAAQALTIDTVVHHRQPEEAINP